MIVVDASVLIAYLAGADAHHERAVALMADPELLNCTASAITWAEVLVAPARAGRLPEVKAALGALVDVAHLPEDSHVQLATLRAETGLKLPDCCVVLAAETRGTGVATFDAALAKVARARGIQVWE